MWSGELSSIINISASGRCLLIPNISFECFLFRCNSQKTLIFFFYPAFFVYITLMKKKIVIIVGGTGQFGITLTKSLLRKNEKVIINNSVCFKYLFFAKLR